MLTNRPTPSVMPSHNNGQPTKLALPLEPATNPRIPASDAPSPLGTLSVLPRELRDEIYRVLIGPGWIFNPDPTHSKWNSWCPTCYSVHYIKQCLCDHIDTTDLPMKALCKSIRQEFLAILQTGAMFIISDDGYSFQNRRRLGRKLCTRDEIPFVDQIQNVEIKAVLYAESGRLYDRFYIPRGKDPHRENRHLRKRGAGPISFFTGKGDLRNTYVITLECSTPKAILILQSPFFDAIRQLTNFQTVTLKVQSSCLHQWPSEDTLAYLGVDFSDSDRTVAIRTIVNSMQSALEPSLGPSVISETLDRETSDAWKIRFHPRDFVFKEEKRNTNSGTQRDEGTKSLPRLAALRSLQSKRAR